MSADRELTEALKRFGCEIGFDLVGVTTAEPFPEDEHSMLARLAEGHLRGLDWFTARRAFVSTHPSVHLPSARSIVSLGISYLGADSTSDSDQGSQGDSVRGLVARYARGADYHRLLRERLRLLSGWVAEHGGELPARGFFDAGWLADRAVARRAGTGWFGKNTCILNRSFGSWTVLAELLTDLDLVPDEPLRVTCGNCERCITACPTGAILGPGVLDNARCISYLTIEHAGPVARELRPLMGRWVFGCDVCQDVCPVNRKARLGRAPELGADLGLRSSRGIGAAPDLRALAELTDVEFAERFRGTVIHRLGRARLARNVAIVLGNAIVGRGSSAALADVGSLGLKQTDAEAGPPILAGLLGDEEPFVRGAAGWALGRIGGRGARQLLLGARRIESDESALEEIDAALDGPAGE